MNVLVKYLLSGLPSNDTNWSKAVKYSKKMKENDMLTGSDGFPPINGFYGIISKYDLDKFFMIGSENEMRKVGKKDIGREVFFVTDGHHRMIAAQMAGIYSLDVEIDNSGFVSVIK